MPPSKSLPSLAGRQGLTNGQTLVTKQTWIFPGCQQCGCGLVFTWLHWQSRSHRPACRHPTVFHHGHPPPPLATAVLWNKSTVHESNTMATHMRGIPFLITVGLQFFRYFQHIPGAYHFWWQLGYNFSDVFSIYQGHTISDDSWVITFQIFS